MRTKNSTTQKSSVEKRKCFVSEKADAQDKMFGRAGVCKRLPVEYEHNGNFYCVLHFPDNEKHKSTNFFETFWKRLEEKRYDFRYVYFSNGLSLDEYTFSETVDFSEAIFAKEVSLIRCIFKSETYFSLCEFNQNADFSGAIFDEQSEIFFSQTSFKKNVDFQAVIYKGYIFFNRIVGKTTNLSNEVWLDFRYAWLEKPERINFHNFQLRPGWFIDIDSRKFNFTACTWKTAGRKRY